MVHFGWNPNKILVLKKAVNPHPWHESDLGQSDIHGPAADWLSSGTASTLNPTPHPLRLSVGACANNCVLFAGTEEIVGKTAVRVRASLWPRPFKARRFSPAFILQCHKTGRSCGMWAHVEVAQGYLMAAAAFRLSSFQDNVLTKARAFLPLCTSMLPC